MSAGKSKIQNSKRSYTVSRSHLFFAPPAPAKPAKPAKAAQQKREKVKYDPTVIAAARELRDRYLEAVNSGRIVLESRGKYDVCRALPAPTSAPSLPDAGAQFKQLPHAA